MPNRTRTRSITQRLALIAAAAGVAITLASCTTTDDTTDSGRQSSITQPAEGQDREKPGHADADIDYVEGGAELAPQLATLRSLDPCALLDPAAGEQATGAVAKTLAPDGELSECNLELVGEAGLVDWTITATIGTSFDDNRRSDGANTSIGGLTFYTSPPTSGGCRLTLDVQPQYGIELAVRSWADAPGREPCDVARTVVKSAPDRWAPLPQRTDKRTAPQLPLATVDPCGLTTAIAAAVNPPITTPVADPDDVYSCVITSTDTGFSAGGRDGAVSIAFELDSFHSTSATPITIAGRDGTEQMIPGVGCDVRVSIDDTTYVQVGSARRTQGLLITAPSCENAAAAAAAALEHVATK